MRGGLLKAIVRRWIFPPGSIHRVRVGPLRGMVFRVGPVTELAPWYSGSERRHQRFFKKFVRPGDVAVDVGANWGGHSLYLSRLVGPGGLVIAFEPWPEAFAELEWHLQHNGALHHVRAFPLALSDADGDALFAPGDSPSQGALIDASSGSGAQQVPIVVKTRTLDAMVQELRLDRLRLVKIDVEGAEGKVLLGARHTVERFAPHFVIDLHTPEQDLAVAKLLTAHQYRIQRLSGPPIVRTDVGWPHQEGVWGSIVAIPPAAQAGCREPKRPCD